MKSGHNPGTIISKTWSAVLIILPDPAWSGSWSCAHFWWGFTSRHFEWINSRMWYSILKLGQNSAKFSKLLHKGQAKYMRPNDFRKQSNFLNLISKRTKFQDWFEEMNKHKTKRLLSSHITGIPLNYYHTQRSETLIFIVKHKKVKNLFTLVFLTPFAHPCLYCGSAPKEWSHGCSANLFQ